MREVYRLVRIAPEISGWRCDGVGRKSRVRSFLSPLRGLIIRCPTHPRLAPWAAFFRSFGARLRPRFSTSMGFETLSSSRCEFRSRFVTSVTASSNSDCLLQQSNRLRRAVSLDRPTRCLLGRVARHTTQPRSGGRVQPTAQAVGSGEGKMHQAPEGRKKHVPYIRKHPVAFHLLDAGPAASDQTGFPRRSVRLSRRHRPRNGRNGIDHQRHHRSRSHADADSARLIRPRRSRAS